LLAEQQHETHRLRRGGEKEGRVVAERGERETSRRGRREDDVLAEKKKAW
jgi:hypothetical protein